ncbi:MAG: YeeE/YedE thiosulfate transporter family protein, partial [Pseudomonadota bacterium]
AGGCISKSIVRAGGGSVKATFICMITALTSYALIYTPAFEAIMWPWLRLSAIDLASVGLHSQRLPEFIGHISNHSGIALATPLVLATIIGAGAICFIKTSARSHLLSGGFIVGLCVVGGWWLTTGPLGAAWVEQMSFEWQPPRRLGGQSLTFVSPLGDAVAFLIGAGSKLNLTFGLITVCGLWAGSFAYHLGKRELHLEFFASSVEFGRAILAGGLLGVGGVLALGCSIGQGVTGFSTLALGSVLATLSMCVGAALAVKVEYYRLVYPEEATLIKGIVATLADWHLLPNAWRDLEKI